MTEYRIWTPPNFFRRIPAKASPSIPVRSRPKTLADPPVAWPSPPMSVMSEDPPEPDGRKRPSDPRPAHPDQRELENVHSTGVPIKRGSCASRCHCGIWRRGLPSNAQFRWIWGTASGPQPVICGPVGLRGRACRDCDFCGVGRYPDPRVWAPAGSGNGTAVAALEVAVPDVVIVNAGMSGDTTPQKMVWPA